MSNIEALQTLFQERKIALRKAPLFDEDPPALSQDLDFDRIEGMMLGLAIGDSLGRSTEGRTPEARQKKHGEVRSYVAGRRAKKDIGLPSDDTQLAFWTLEQLNADRAFLPARLAKKFVKSGVIYGMGKSVSMFRRNVKKGLPWDECGVDSAGNGALMRIAPMLIPHLRTQTKALWADAALSAMLTHNDTGSIAACVAFVDILWRLLSMKAAPDAGWWVQRYVTLARDMETDHKYKPRGGDYTDYEGAMWAFVEERVPEAIEKKTDTVTACNAWHSGAYLLETMPCVMLLLARYADDPEEAIVRAVNDTKDNDTVAAIVGAAVGALHGAAALPARWIDGLSGRTKEDDDGKVFEILDAARQIWWEDASLLRVPE